MTLVQSIYNTGIFWTIRWIPFSSILGIAKFRTAIQQGDLDFVNRLLEIDAMLAQASYWSFSMLCLAVKSGQFEIFNRLLVVPEVLANVHAHDNEVLRIAAQTDQHPIIVRLLQIPAVLRNTFGLIMALDMAIQKNHVEIVNVFLQNPVVIENAKASSLRDAIKLGRFEIAKRLFEIPAVLHAVISSRDMYALLLAITHGHFDIINRALKIPEILKKVASDDNELLWYAAKDKRIDIIKLLLKNEAVRKDKSFDDLIKKYRIIQTAWNELVKQDRKNVLLFFKISQLPPELSFKIATFTLSHQFPGSYQKALPKYLDRGYELALDWQSSREGVFLINYYELNRQMKRLTLDDASQSESMGEGVIVKADGFLARRQAKEAPGVHI